MPARFLEALQRTVVPTKEVPSQKGGEPVLPVQRETVVFRPTRRRLTGPVALLATPALALSLAACGSDAKPSSAQETTGISSSAPTTPRETVTVTVQPTETATPSAIPTEQPTTVPPTPEAFSVAESDTRFQDAAKKILSRYQTPQIEGEFPDDPPVHETPTSYEIMLRDGIVKQNGNKKWKVITLEAELNQPDSLDPTAATQVKIRLEHRQVPGRFDPGDRRVKEVVMTSLGDNHYTITTNGTVVDNTNPDQKAAYTKALRGMNNLLTDALTPPK